MRKFDLSLSSSRSYYFHTFRFFFQAEDGIRDRDVTGVQTCALPIWKNDCPLIVRSIAGIVIIAAVSGTSGAAAWYCEEATLIRSSPPSTIASTAKIAIKIGRASCRERVWCWEEGRVVQQEASDVLTS